MQIARGNSTIPASQTAAARVLVSAIVDAHTLTAPINVLQDPEVCLNGSNCSQN